MSRLEDPRSPKSALPQEAKRPRGHVLVVDDDRDFAESLAALLELEGYAVTIAFSFDAALVALAERPPDVALVDIRLGQSNGVDLVRTMRGREPELLCVMVTAYSSIETTIEALKAGAYDYLCKPFFTADLLATLERCFELRWFADERARALAALAASEERLRQVLDHSPSAIALDDPDSRRLLSNARFLEYFPAGLPDALVAGAVAPAAREVEVTSADGGRRRLLVTRFPVRDSGERLVGVGTIGTDVTERHLMEERLRQAQRMEAIGELTGGIAHDFNNLLAVILGNLRLLQEACAPRPELRELLEDALDATRSGVDLTARLLAFGRGQPLHPETTDLRDLLLTLSRLIGRTLGEDIAVRLALAPDLWSVRVDRHQLETSLLNLAINARDAMPGGGCLIIEARNVEVRSAELESREAGLDPDIRPGCYVALSVADTGTGMTAAVRHRAIQPFFTTKSPGRGNGLGLSMVYGFVRQSDGHLGITSEPGNGTKVTLYFPRADAQATVSATPANSVPAGRGEHVLLVEDQPRVRQLLQRQITRLGYHVSASPDARQALEALRSRHVDLLFTDVVLAGDMNGIELAEAALASSPGLAVLLTTGYAADALASRSASLTASGVLCKPVDPEILARSLRAALDRRTGARGDGTSERQPSAGDATNM